MKLEDLLKEIHEAEEKERKIYLSPIIDIQNKYSFYYRDSMIMDYIWFNDRWDLDKLQEEKHE